MPSRYAAPAPARPAPWQGTLGVAQPAAAYQALWAERRDDWRWRRVPTRRWHAGAATALAARDAAADDRRSASPSRSCTASTSSRRTATGLVLVDMHAAHERILLRDASSARSTQRAVDSAAAADPGRPSTPRRSTSPPPRSIARRSRALGFEVSALSPTALAVRAVPALLAGGDVAGAGARAADGHPRVRREPRCCSERQQRAARDHGLPRRGARQSRADGARR